MRILRALFFITYLLFHVGILWVSISAFFANQDFTERLEWEKLLAMRQFIPYAPVFAFIGMGLFFINLWMYFYYLNRRTRRIKFLEQERSEYKAKLFDMTAKPLDEAED